jgi:hypothetical protein
MHGRKYRCQSNPNELEIPPNIIRGLAVISMYSSTGMYKNNLSIIPTRW